MMIYKSIAEIKRKVRYLKIYSYEISQLLAENNYNIDSETYLHICSTSPQLIRIKYDAWSDNFEMLDRENNYWKFKVYRKGE